MAGTSATNCTTSATGVQCDRLYNEETKSEFYILRNRNISGFDNFDFKLNIGKFFALSFFIQVYGIYGILTIH